MRVGGVGEIDYYEELGVERNATPEQIRDAFRALVRLLHPDHQQDESLKAIADRQLRKLNRIHSVLSDPERRRRYDLSLQENFRPAPTIVVNTAVPFAPRETLTRFVWIAAAVVGVAVVIWLATDPPAAPVLFPERAVRSVAPAAETRNSGEAPAANQGTARVGDSDEVLQLRAALRAARAELAEAREELSTLRPPRTAPKDFAAPASATTDTAPQPPGALSSSAMSEVVPPRLTPAPARPVSLPGAVATAGPLLKNPKTAGPDAHDFASFWFFTKAPDAKREQNLYYPEYIEATLTEQNGSIHGRYRSRYIITDRAVSPDVNFEFNGTPSNGTIVCSWAGPGGARGQLTLRITSENAMRVEWVASETGSVQALTSGKATLTRRVE